ncbi:MAG: hypothetical protein ACKOJF_33995, partial [Planctomycetaceae bacterium]
MTSRSRQTRLRDNLRLGTSRSSRGGAGDRGGTVFFADAVARREGHHGGERAGVQPASSRCSRACTRSATPHCEIA